MCDFLFIGQILQLAPIKDNYFSCKVMPSTALKHIYSDSHAPIRLLLLFGLPVFICLANLATLS